MEDVRKQDPTFTNFVPATAAEAVDRYVRCRRNGLKPMLVPECLIACAVGLQGTELDDFENWIINPNADLDKVKLVRDDTIRLYNDKIYKENLLRFTDATGTPPLVADDEKMPIDTDDITALREAVQEKLDLSPVAQRSMLLT
jgi:hypothetical protein